jgi:hypothetical protein
MAAPNPDDGRPFVVGDIVRILPEFYDVGDSAFERIIVEVIQDGPSVLVRTMRPGLDLQSTEVIAASKLLLMTNLDDLLKQDPETAITRYAGHLTQQQRISCVLSYPFETLGALGDLITTEEIDLCVKKHPSIALNLAAERLTQAQLDHLAENYSFSILLYAAHRLGAEKLSTIVAGHPGECIIILERHPESRLRQALQEIRHDIPPIVSSVLAVVRTPGG